MFDIGWTELLVIGVVALIAIGPKELPGALRTLGHWMGKIRRMAGEFQNQFQEAMREAEMADIKKQVDQLTSGFDPIEATRREIESTMEDKPPSALPSPASDPGATDAIAANAPSAYAPTAETSPEHMPAEPAPPAAVENALAADAASSAKSGDRS